VIFKREVKILKPLNKNYLFGLSSTKNQPQTIVDFSEMYAYVSKNFSVIVCGDYYTSPNGFYFVKPTANRIFAC
jgi:hypothetical protein